MSEPTPAAEQDVLAAVLRLAERWDAVSVRLADGLDADQHNCRAVRGETACEVYGRHADDLLAALGPWLVPQITTPPAQATGDADV